MAAQKQARRSSRQAVSVKKSASHGGRSRTGPTSQATAPPPSAGDRRTTARTPAAVSGAAAADPGATQAGGGVADWIRSRPLPFTTWLLSLFGLGVSIYLTLTHFFSSVSLVCSDKGVINCAKVTSSSQSMVFGIFPVAVLGLVFYVFMALINSPLGWRYDTALVRWARLGSVIVGMGFVLYLIYAEIIQIGNVCLWCTSVHVATFALFVLLVYDATSWTSATTGRY